jgi:hypothetical protein
MFALLFRMHDVSLTAGPLPVLEVTAECEPSHALGRQKCVILASTSANIQWADVQVLETPAFVQPLRGRLSMESSDNRAANAVRWSLGLVARAEGSGITKVRVRAVLCTAEVCSPVSVIASATISVSSAP